MTQEAHEHQDRALFSGLMSILFLPVCGAVMYADGRSYRQGYLDGWGFDETLMDLSVQETLYRGFLGQMSILLPGLLALAGVVGALGLAALIGTLARKFFPPRSHRSPRKYEPRRREPLGPVQPLIGITALVILAHFAVAMIWEPVRLMGMQLAMKEGQCALEEPCKGLPPTATVRINDQSGTVRDIRARVVTCNNDRCGLQTADGVLTVPKSAIASSVVSPPIPRSAAR